MKFETLLKRLSSYKNGTFVKVSWTSDVSSAKAKKSGITVTKKCEGLVRVGINYSNLKAVQEELATKDPNAPKKESWYTHCEESSCLVQSKSDADKKYLQVFPIPGKKIKSHMTLTSEDVTNAEVRPDNLYGMGYITKSALPNKEEIRVFTISVDKLTSFGGAN